MLDEVVILSSDLTEALDVLKDEINNRIINGDGYITSLTRVVEALDNADRILIQ